MFLFILIIFPLLAYFLFNMSKDNYKESNGAVKLIGIIGIIILVLLITSEILNAKESYLLLILIWYFLVFFYYYIQHIKLQLKNLIKLKYEETMISGVIIKLFFIIFIFIFYINIISDYDIIRSLNIFRYNSEGILNTSFIFLASILLAGLFYEVVDSVTNNIFKKITNTRSLKSKLKSELKREILADLKK